MYKRAVLLAHGWGLTIHSLSALVRAFHRSKPEWFNETLWLGLDSGYAPAEASIEKILTWNADSWDNQPSQRVNLVERLASQLGDLPCVGIGHSLGFAKLNRIAKLSVNTPTAEGKKFSPFAGLVSLHGFNRFCALEENAQGTPPRVLRRMIQQFERNPELVLADFIQRAGLVDTSSQNQAIAPTQPGPGLDHLAADLVSMLTLNDPLAQGMPNLWVAAKDDAIVSQPLIKGLACSPEANPGSFTELGVSHMSPLTEPSLYTERLFEFINQCLAKHN